MNIFMRLIAFIFLMVLPSLLASEQFNSTDNKEKIIKIFSKGKIIAEHHAKSFSSIKTVIFYYKDELYNCDIHKPFNDKMKYFYINCYDTNKNK